MELVTESNKSAKGAHNAASAFAASLANGY